MGAADFRIPRKAWYKLPKNDHSPTDETAQAKDGRWLADWRDESAYVLLGDPGSGKTESLRAEAEATGGILVSAALIQAGVAPSFDPDALVFIDAVDEVKGGGGGNVVAEIARYLRDNGKPRFRIACREADWRADADRELLEAVAPNGQLKELHLSPLGDQDIQDILNSRSKDLPDPQAFIEQAKTQGVQDWLRNPLLLNLMVDSVAQNGQLPNSRLGIYEAACYVMAQDHNVTHFEKQALSAGVVQNVIEDAGGLCALLLLGGQTAISRSAKPALKVLALPTLPKELKLHDTAQTVKSKLFSTEGDLIRPRHRTIAEFLGAQALAKRIDKGLPLSRVLALVQGHDGVPVESMRGLCAWLAVHLQGDQRRLVLEADPLGFIINGDAAELIHDERLKLIRALAELSQQNPWFRNGQWESHPFGPLATPDMQEVFAQELAKSERSQAHQVFIDCLLDALQHAPQPMPVLVPLLAQWVMDAQVHEFVRVSAYHAWYRHVSPEERGAQINAWLDALEDHRHALKNLIEAFLYDAYPNWIQADVLRFLPNDDEGLSVWWFWSHEFMRLTPPNLVPSLARAWLEKFPKGVTHGYNFERKEVANALLCAVVEQHGDLATHQDLYEWLAIGLNEHGSVHQNEKSEGIVRWLQARPDKIKAVAKLCWKNVKVDQQGTKFFHVALKRLRLVSMPDDWVRWQMSVALDVADVDLVRYLIEEVNFSVERKSAGFDLPTEQELGEWVDALSAKHPEAVGWFQEARIQVSRVLGETKRWDAEDVQRRKRHEEEREHQRQKRQKEIKPHLNQWPAKPLPARFLSGIADAYEKYFSDIQGETPEARVVDYLGSSFPQDLEKALDAMDACLVRDDLPSVEEIIDIPNRNKRYYLQNPCLLAARRICERDPQAWRTWPEGIQQKLFAFWLTCSFGETPHWFIAVGAEFPDAVAPVLCAFTKSKFKQKLFQSITGLWHLSQEPTWQVLAERALPELLGSFPAKVGEDGTRILNRDLLRAIHKLPSSQAKALVEKKLALKSLDSGQRLAWLVAWLRYEPRRAVEALVEQVDNVEAQHRRVVMLGAALRQQGVLSQDTVSLPVACVRRLIELFAPMTTAADWPGGFVTEEEERRDMVRALLSNLGNNPNPEAATALQTLVNNSKLKDWRQKAQFHLQQQQHLQREATFQPASVQAAAKVLCNQGPANASDLLALVVDHLRCLEAALRGDPATALRHFWREHVSIDENTCTLELLQLLRPRLQAMDVTLEHESQAAHGKRMDLRATRMLEGQRITLTIEAKKENHKDVWSAWRDQLQKRYTIDPGAQERGIYLVYWFGQSPKSAPPLDGNQPSVKPQSATEMQTMLEARIPSKDRHLIKVVVLDLSWPD